jgi:hypothetical protein
MSLKMNPSERTPMWNKSMARYLGAPLPSSGGVQTEPTKQEIPALRVDEKILARLGLKLPPSDPRLLGEFLTADDAADAASDADEFTRGVRRAVRLSQALSAGLHRQARQPWKQWVEAHFKVGYACFHRYHVAADLQIGLITRGLPLLANENQSRNIAPFRRHERFWEALATFPHGFPPAAELKTRLRSALGLEAVSAAATTRIKLHRILQRVVTAVPVSEDEPVVMEALSLVRRAIAVLEKGGTAA